MKGLIVAYDRGVEAGVIKGSDNKAYFFTKEEWADDTDPQEDLIVVFEPGPWRAFKVNADRAALRASRIETGNFRHLNKIFTDYISVLNRKHLDFLTCKRK